MIIATFESKIILTNPCYSPFEIGVFPPKKGTHAKFFFCGFLS